MKNGDVREFVDHIHYGDELWFLYIMPMEKSSAKRQNLPLKEQRRCFTKIQRFISNTKNFLRGAIKCLMEILENLLINCGVARS